MLFMSSGQNRAMERMMTEVPNFLPRRRGVIIVSELHQQNECTQCDTCRDWENGRCLFDLCINMTKRIFDQEVTFKELILFTHIRIRDNDFRMRLNEYIKESGTKSMTFLNANHQKLFTEVTKHKECGSAAFLSAIYLLTADDTLWVKAVTSIGASTVQFGNIRLGTVSVEVYTLFMTAKDLYSGSKNITIRDLADKNLISQQIFNVICNAMTLRRYGKEALLIAQKEVVKV